MGVNFVQIDTLPTLSACPLRSEIDRWPSKYKRLPYRRNYCRHRGISERQWALHRARRGWEKWLIDPSLMTPSIGATAHKRRARARINSTILSLRARCCALLGTTSFLPRGPKREPRDSHQNQTEQQEAIPLDSCTAANDFVRHGWRSLYGYPRVAITPGRTPQVRASVLRLLRPLSPAPL